MSARLGFNEEPYIPWKGKTFAQISSIIKNNKWINENMNANNYFRSQPVKHYRREIASMYDNSNCNSRLSYSIDELDRPNGSIVTQSPSPLVSYKGLVGSVDIQLTNNTTERPGICTNPYICSETNARNRVRSSGMIKRKYNLAKNNDIYYTSSKQHLVSRNKTFEQNQYNYLRSGDSSSKPGDSVSGANTYSTQGLNHCQKYHISSDTSFDYQWLDKAIYTVSVPAGYYDVEDLNSTLKSTLMNNDHYFIDSNGFTKVYLLNIAYDSAYNKIELQSFLSNKSLYSTLYGAYSVPTDMSNQSWTNGPNTDTSIDTSGVPVFIIKNNAITAAIGLNAGYYPSVLIGEGQILANQVSYSAYPPGVKPTYVPVYYKPSNTQFAQQGGVSASSLITRVKYNAITNNTVGYNKAYGSAVANSLAYGVPNYGYTLKDRIGYPNIKSPAFDKTTGNLKTCNTSEVSHMRHVTK